MKARMSFLQLFKSILRFYPSNFRTEFEDEMGVVFADREVELAKQAFPIFIALSLREFFDLFINLFREHWIEFQKERNMNRGIIGKPDQRNYILFGSLLFGLFAAITYLVSEILGLSRLEFSQYSLPIDILLVTIVFFLLNGCRVWIFWRATPRGVDQWGFLPSVLGSTLLTLLYALISQFDLIYKFGYQFGLSQDFVLVGYGILQAVISGLVFGGLFGWAYAGKRMLVPFLSISVIGYLVRYLISTGVLAYTRFAFPINWWLPIYWNTNIWFSIWQLSLSIIGSMLVGVLLGWQVSIANKHVGEKYPLAG